MAAPGRLLKPLFFSSMACLCFSACAPITVEHTTIQNALSDFRQDVLTNGQLSQISAQYLSIHNLTQQYEKDPAGVIKTLEQPGVPTETPDRAFTLAEAALAQAIGLEQSNPRSAADWHLVAAAKAYDALFPADCALYTRYDTRPDRLRLFYGRAVAGWTMQLKKLGKIAPEERTVLGETYRVGIKRGPNLEDPNAFSELMISLQIQFEGLRHRSVRRGIGVPLLGWQVNRQENAQERYYPPVGLARALSAVAFFSKPEAGQRSVEFGFYDSYAQEAVAISGQEVPLAADFTAAFGYQISKTPFKSVNFAQTADVQEGIKATGFYMRYPYDPNKIPLILVHGLLSSPITWMDVTNTLLADPEIRKNYQIWYFYYPPGLPIMIAAEIFREKLDELYRTFDPKGVNPKMNDTIVVAHSMGGLLAQTVVGDSGSAFWEKLFGKPEDQLPLPSDLKAELDKVLNFEHKRFITRIVFISVPHRGSPMADSFIGEVGRKLISLPQQMVSNLHQLRSRASKYLLPQARESLATADEANSVTGLAPENPVIQALAQIAVARGIKFHSIIGDAETLPDGETSDGVVPYSSSHLAGAESELIVPSGHSAQDHPLAILEIERILRLHLQAYRQQHPLAAKGKDLQKALCPETVCPGQY